MKRLFTRGSAGESPQTASPITPLPTPPTNYAAGPARPLRLVYTDEKGKFHMDPEALAVLQLVKEPVGVVSVCGRARQGKSFILNQGTYSTQIFSLAVLLSSMFIYNQMGGIDEAALDRLSLVTEMTKHIRVRASGGRTTTSELGQFSPIFVWLLRDFYLDLVEENRKITPRDYLELALRPVQGGGRDVTAKNEIRESIRALFPDRECFTLVRPLSNENDLQRLDQIALERLRPEFRSGLDALTRFVFERTRPKQFGAVVMTGPILARITQSFLDALNNGAVPTISSSWQVNYGPFLWVSVFIPGLVGLINVSSPNRTQLFLCTISECSKELIQNYKLIFFCHGLVKIFLLHNIAFISKSYMLLSQVDSVASVLIFDDYLCQNVEEAECQRAYELATETYMTSFNRAKPPEEVALREAHEDAVQKSVAAFNATAVGTGSTRQKYENRLQSFLKKAFEDIKKDAFREAYLQCTNAIESMEKELRIACQSPGAKVDTVIKVIDGLLSKYEDTCHGPEKWRKAVVFLRQSLEGPIMDLIRKQLDQIGTEKSSLTLKCRSIEDKMGLLNKQLEASEKYKSEYLKRYEDAINDKKKLTDDYMSRITNLQKKCSSLEEKSSNLSKTLETERRELQDWKRKYDLVLSKQKAEEEQASAELAMLRSKSSAAEARLAAAQEKAESAMEEAEEWKRKYDVAVREVKTALEKAASIQERTNHQAQAKEAALRAEFSRSLAEKEIEIKEKQSKFEQAEQHLTTLSLELKAAESKIKNYDLETSTLKDEMKELIEKVEHANTVAQSAESNAKILEQEKIYLEQKYQTQFDRFEELHERCKGAEIQAKRATELADEARAEAVAAQKDKSDFQRVAMERLAQIERAERYAESLERQKADLANEVERYKAAERDALFKVEMLEERVREREKEIETHLQSSNNQRKNTVHVLESLLESERVAHAEANNRAEALSVQLQVTQGKLDALSQEFNTLRFSDKATLDSKLRTASHVKRGRTDEYEVGVDSVHDTGTNDRATRANKKAKSNSSPLKFASPEDGGSVFKGDEDASSQQTSTEDYTKFTVQKLKQELTKHNFGAELLQLRNPNKKDIVALYEKCILQKS
ncbi:myosin-10-like [Dorcoceras hygrometricum]|uniref:Myosin-10-like n=1 Tax=Dorcoceras hygrometricum TaxID=472368 RepID=A0A2Z7D265_9LAMI|nr:myosin-10-like [Dorcoceras hygrometricum]